MTIGEISWLVRSQLRHRLQQLHSEALEMREDLARDRSAPLRARGLAEDLTSWITELTWHRNRLLGEVKVIEQAVIVSALCRHCGAKIIPAGAWWEDERGITACVKGAPRDDPQPGEPVFTAPVLHEPMPAGLDGAAQ